MKQRKVLIIKLGYCETLIHEKGFTPSLGDVFRHTCLLPHYADAEVTWLTSSSAAPLLTNNPLIHKLLEYDENILNKLSNESFDEILCLEKASSLCDLARRIPAKRRMGFDFTEKRRSAHPGAESALDIANGRDQFIPLQALLYQMIGDYWRGEDYILGYKPKATETAEIGLNIHVGKKWPTKAWPMRHWKMLGSMLENHGLKVSWQQGCENLYDYMDWISGNKLVVTSDSLGMHLGLAMKKKVVALFGPTPSENIYMYGRGVILTADWACPEAPCHKAKCSNKQACMREIRPKVVARTVVNLLNGSRIIK